jgi:CelD/BcsL family acetyltransferase involved in cellulose biosynthesis
MSLIDPIPVPQDVARAQHEGDSSRHPQTVSMSGADRLRVRLLDPQRLSPAAARRWATLCACGVRANVFAADWLLAPALAMTGERGVRLAVVEDSAGGWLGMLPLILGTLPGRWPLPMWRSWPSPFAPLATPLLRPGAERAFWDALLGHFDRRPGLAAGFVAEALPLDDPATLALIGLAAEQARPVHHFRTFTRPARTAGQPGDGRAAAVLGRRLDRLEARLEATFGPVRLVLHQRPGEGEPWLGAFLALARGGGSGEVPPDLLRAAIREGHRRGAVRLASLTAGETIVAMAGWLVAGQRGHALGTSSDTRFAGFAPHRLLERRVASLAAIEGLERFDLCGATDALSTGPLCPAQHAFTQLAVAIGGPRRRALLARALDRSTRRV